MRAGAAAAFAQVVSADTRHFLPPWHGRCSVARRMRSSNHGTAIFAAHAVLLGEARDVEGAPRRRPRAAPRAAARAPVAASKAALVSRFRIEHGARAATVRVS